MASYHSIKYRLKSDFQLSIICILATFVTCVMTPFTLLRLIEGNYITFILDLFILIFSNGAALYAWHKRDTEKPALFLALLVTIGMMLSSYINPQLAPYWVYSVILFDFSLLSARRAILLSTVSLAAILFSNNTFHDKTAIATFAVSGFTTLLFAFIFTLRNEYQRLALHALARTDPLTGAINRRGFDEECARAIRQHQRTKNPIALALIDLDHFKKINDQFGHEVGDNTLKKVVAIIQQQTRASDRLFRIGGEEFCLIMENTAPSGASINANKLRKLIMHTSISQDFTLTVSIGVNNLTPEDTPESWLKQADVALYEAKRAGRNRCYSSAELSINESTTEPLVDNSNNL